MAVAVAAVATDKVVEAQVRRRWDSFQWLTYGGWGDFIDKLTVNKGRERGREGERERQACRSEGQEIS